MNNNFIIHYFHILKKFKFLLIFFPILATFLFSLYIFSFPNKYKIFAILQEKTNNNLPKLNGNLGILSSFAGIKLPKSEEVSVSVYYKILKNDPQFMKKFFKKYKIKEKYLNSININNSNLIFSKPTNITKQLYLIFQYKKQLKLKEKGDYYFLFKPISNSLFVKKDPQTGLIYISFINYDRKFAYELLSNFIKYSSNYLLKKRINSINKELKKYQELYNKNYNIEIRNDITKLIFHLIKEKTFLESNKLYKLKYLVKPYIPLKEQNVNFRKSFAIILFLISFLIFELIIIWVVLSLKKIFYNLKNE